MAAAADFEKLFQFESGDISYNRRGELSPRQQQVKRAESRGCLTRLLAVLGAAAALFVIGLFVLEGEIGELVGGIGITGILMTTPFLIIYLASARKSTNQVLTVDGTAKLSMGYTKGTNKYYMVVINDVDFRVNQMVYDAFEEDTRYIVYYTRAGSMNSIVSLEVWT